MLRSWWRQALVVCLFLLIASCSGGGCSSGCASCGITPIAGASTTSQTIANSASVRVTKPGLEFLGGSIPGLAASLLGHGATGGIIDFDVPTTPISTSVIGISINLSVCPNGANTTTNPLQCVAEIEIGSASLAINSVTPDAITISGTIPVRIQELIITGNVPLLGNIQIDLGVGSNLGCDSNAGAVAAGVGFYGFPITVTLPLVAETIPPRIGYTKVDAANASANLTIGSGQLVACSTDKGIGGDIVNALLGILPGIVAPILQTQIGGIVVNELKTQLCTKADATLNPPCPTGTQPEGDAGDPLLPDGGVPASQPNCVYDTAPTSCLPTELGLEGHINLGSLLASISPGTTGAVDFVIAANGNMIAAPNGAADSNGNTPNGITLGLLGGGLPRPSRAASRWRRTRNRAGSPSRAS